ncbi:glycosyltransferase family 32 protein [Peribacillus sp. NPDC097198]|uniref:glycosyltransferase family 32 protein n=1 Tax=Peribacillus sp. NPDC097198 TaxID=3364397 RepID=UPI00380F8970
MESKHTESIPKIIHYCWFGHEEKSKFILNCIDTWEKKLPNYLIMEWNEVNFPVDYNDYVIQAYKNKKYAFVSDVARLYALSHYGGIYFDTDIEARNSMDPYLMEEEIIMAFESDKVVMTGFFAAKKESLFIKKWLETYDSLKFVNKDGTFDVTPNTFRVSNMLEKEGLCLNGQLQTLDNGITVYPKEIFGAYDVDNSAYVITSDTVVIHHCRNSWRPLNYKVKNYIKRSLAKLLGVKIYKMLRVLVKKGVV